jgi:two-component system sensor histidine kinase VanS
MLLIVICVVAMFFFNQITAALESMERQQMMNIFAPLVSQMGGKTEDEIFEMAEEFHKKNNSVEFVIQAADGFEIYQSPNSSLYNQGGDKPITNYDAANAPSSDKFQVSEHLPNGITIIMTGTSAGGAVYDEFIRSTIIVLLLLFLAGMLGAAVFAGLITKPIKNIARDTKRMSDLEFVPPPVASRDEIGQLAKDVYRMYEELKTEIEREREMEENQRYFFSAASHELKTPIASVRSILEGMLDDLIEVSEYPDYLHECIKTIDAHNKLIIEILEITHLTDGSIKLEKESLEIKGLITDVLTANQIIYEAKNQVVDIDLPKDITLAADRRLLSKVLSNVIINAIQNTPDGGQIKIFLKVDSTTQLCVLNVGVKINEDIMPKLFQPFFREDESRSRGQGRSGVGLTIVQKALDKMRIPFGLENTDGGVLFWIELIG